MATKSFGFHHYQIASVYSNKELEPCNSVSGNSLCCVSGKITSFYLRVVLFFCMFNISFERHIELFLTIEDVSKDH